LELQTSLLLSQNIARAWKYFGILQPEIPNMAVDATGEQQPKGFSGIIFWGKSRYCHLGISF